MLRGMDEGVVIGGQRASGGGAAKWAAVGLLGGVSLVGLAWAVLGGGGGPAPVAAQAPAVIQPVAPTIIVNVPPPATGPEIVSVVGEVAGEVGPKPIEAGVVAAVETRAVKSSDEPAAGVMGKKINLNTATLEELDLLPGVGKATAQAILAYRTKVGKFRTVSELDKVSGIGPAKLEKIRPLVMVE
jgi:competence protein ComEA